MDNVLSEKLAMISGCSPEDYALKQLSNMDKQEINAGLETFFMGLTLGEWLTGKKLGDAWENSLDQLRSWVYKIEKINPAVVYLRHAVFEHRQKWKWKINSSKNINDLISCPDDKKNDWQDNAQKQINEGAAIISRIISKFETATPKTIEPEDKTPGKVIVQERENQREERTRK